MSSGSRALLLLLLLCAAALPRGVEAQWRASGGLAAAADTTELEPRGLAIAEPSTEELVFAGLLGGAAGLAAGGWLGYRLEMSDGCDSDYFCGFGGGLLGASLGMSLGSSLGVHLGNDRRGSYGITALGAMGGLVAGSAAAAAAVVALGDAGVVLTLAIIPGAQVAGAIAAQRASARAAARRADRSR